MTAVLERPPVERIELLDLAAECAEYIVARNPYVRMIAVSGSLIRPEHNGGHEDIDFFVITQRGRIWEGFLGCLLHGWRFARSRGLDRTFFCFNYLVDEGEPQEVDLRRREYARELLNLRVLHGMDVYWELLEHHATRLRAAQPELFEVALAALETSTDTGREVRVSAAHGLAYRLAALPFRLVAKRMEARRRRLYPGGHIYSNGRVIRSHFRRGWHNEGAEEDALPASAAFDDIASTYEQEVVASPANRHMREVVWEELDKLIEPGMHVLDLGAGSGEDAVWLAHKGATVLAIDVSAAMVDEAARRVRDAGLQDSVEVRRLAIENLRTLLPERERSFDLVLCNFGALNLAGEPGVWGPVLARLLRPEGKLVASVMSRWCLPELVAGFLRLRPKFAVRRVVGAPIVVGGVPLATALYTPGGLGRDLRSHFVAERTRGLCALLPPPGLERAIPGVFRSRFLRAVDRTLGRLPVLRGAGDHFLMVMRPRLDGYTLFKTRAPITASPVVEDVNGDGSPEVVVAAEKLYVLDARGKALRGWPVKAGKPFASTPAVVRDGDGAMLFAGSDDHALHGFSLDGRRLAGFPYRTGGDIFSSPWAGDLDGDCGEDLAFGSDDGNVYVIRAGGDTRPGWPVRTVGYVSASPVVARTHDDDAALFIGSWDGSLYGIGAGGRALPGWPRRLGFPVWSSAAVADIDGDGFSEVVVATQRLFALRGDGESLPGFPVALGGYAVASPAIGDIDGDGRPEVVVASDRVYAFRGDGSSVDGFPLDLEAYVWASPLLVDIDGDGLPEIIVADMKGYVWAIKNTGEVLDGWPRRAGSRIAAAPTAADLDRDGYLELLVATWDGCVVVNPTGAKAGDYAASPWRSFPQREVPCAPLAAAGRPNPAAEELADNGRVNDVSARAEVRLKPSRPLPYRVTDVHLEVETEELLLGGLLYYELNGRLHPSPLLGREGRYFAIMQPLPPLKRIDFHFELLTGAGASVRLPELGSYRMTVGMTGVQQVRTRHG